MTRRIVVATCIGCGARSSPGMCLEGCDDVPLDLVDVADVERTQLRLERLHARTTALRAVADALGDPTAGWDDLRARAREALRTPPPEQEPPATIVAAWGCPRCGRVDAPQPCIGVCIREPVLMADAGEYLELAAQADALAATEHELTAVVGLLAHVTARAGHEDETRAVLADRALAVLSGAG